MDTLEKKLQLNKETIAKLNDAEQASIYGGATGSDRLCTHNPCLTNGCPPPQTLECQPLTFAAGCTSQQTCWCTLYLCVIE